MRQYYEARESVAEGEEGEYICTDVTGMTELEKAEIQAAIEDILSGVSYRLVAHDCYHDEKKGECPTPILLKEV
ncbi:MAG: hypothetical protein SVK08_00560 [Halobacteriota archaeon]|nr:hypothetical protein [Halobacteriota archaeon]